MKTYRSARGERVYAVGDIHGREDLFQSLMTRIEDDAASRRPMKTRIVVLGDVIDRGPTSSSLVRRLIRYTQVSKRFIVLMGNHEQLMMAALEGDHEMLDAWLQIGGDATLRSWGVASELVEPGASYALIRAARDAITADTLSWFHHLPLFHRSGELLFVHAGVRPGVALSRQRAEDLLWIGSSFLDSEEPRRFLTVHGHTIVEEGPQVRSNRIGIDTGAYRTDRLTAVGLEGADRWFLST